MSGQRASASTYHRAQTRKGKSERKLASSPMASVGAIIIAVLWTVPTAGLLITSFRPQDQIRRSGWWTVFANPEFTFANYEKALGTSGTVDSFINSFIITIPGVVLPIIIALCAAYAFAWMDFPGKNALFAGVFALQVVPIQVALIPLLTRYVQWGIAGTYWAVWISHTIFALPLAIYLLHNFMSEIPRSLIEAARVDGAGHARVFLQVILPLMKPAIASYAIFQFLWVWNDLLVSLTFANVKYQPITRLIAQLVGSHGSSWYLLAAGAFISMVVPVAVFLALQKYFVRGLLAGGLKG